jgi:hypothetical protein
MNSYYKTLIPNIHPSLIPYLVGYWTADNVANDTHINNLGGAFVNAAWATGKNNQSFSYGNTTTLRYINIPDSPLLSFTDGINDKPFTLNMWVKFTTFNPSNINVILNKMYNTTDREYLLYLDTATKKYSFVKYSLGTSTNSVITRTPTMTINTSDFYMLTITSDGTKFGDEIYINAVDETDTYTETGTYVKMQDGNNVLRLGMISYPETTANYNAKKHRGMLDEFSIFNKKFNQAEILTLHNLGVGKFYPNI